MSEPNPADHEPVAFTASDRRALAAVATQFFVNGAVFASFVPRLPEIRDQLDISVADLGLLLTLAAAFGLGGSLITGHLIERFGTRTVLVAGGLALVGSLALIGVATTPLLLLVGLAGIQTFDVLVDVSMNLQASWLNARRHAPVLNRLHGLWSLGTVVGGVASTRIAGAGVLLRTHLLLAAIAFAVIVAMVGSQVLRTDEHEPDAKPASDGDAANAAHSRQRARRRLPLILFALAGATSITVEMTSSDWASFRLADDFGASVGFAGFGFVAYTSGMTTARLGGDWLLTRLGPDRLDRLAKIVAVIGLSLATLAPNQWLSMAGYVIAGLGIATFFPKLYDDAARLPGRPGAGIGAMTAGSRGALLLTPTIVGMLAATSLSVGTATALVTLPAALGYVAISTRLARLSPSAATRPNVPGTNDRP